MKKQVIKVEDFLKAIPTLDKNELHTNLSILKKGFVKSQKLFKFTKVLFYFSFGVSLESFMFTQSAFKPKFKFIFLGTLALSLASSVICYKLVNKYGKDVDAYNYLTSAVQSEIKKRCSIEAGVINEEMQEVMVEII